jgi:hypothetical protein
MIRALAHGPLENVEVCFPGTCNARMDKLDVFWRNQFGYTHEIAIVTGFYDCVSMLCILTHHQAAADELAWYAVQRALEGEDGVFTTRAGISSNLAV